MPTQPSQADLTALMAIAERIAHGADQILLQSFGKVSASLKSDGTLVTQADHAVDEFITQQLTACCPDHAILSEERNTIYQPTATFTWVIDPLDGTTNFARGLPIWGVSIALLYFGVPIVGLLSFSSLREQYRAVAGYGATLNDTPLHTSENEATDDQHFMMQCTRTARAYRVDTPLKPRILGSAAYHLATVAKGSALAGIEATPKLWDIAAALLIISEAGGTYQRLDTDSPIFPLESQTKNYALLAFPLLAAANVHILEELESGIARR